MISTPVAERLTVELSPPVFSIKVSLGRGSNLDIWHARRTPLYRSHKIDIKYFWNICCIICVDYYFFVEIVKNEVYLKFECKAHSTYNTQKVFYPNMVTVLTLISRNFKSICIILIKALNSFQHNSKHLIEVYVKSCL